MATGVTWGSSQDPADGVGAIGDIPMDENGYNYPVSGGMGGQGDLGDLGDEYDDEDEEEMSDESSDEEVLSPEHPLLARVQNVIHDQLTEERRKLDLDLREKKETLKKDNQERENLGVELYQAQQQLAQQQVLLERVHDRSNDCSAKREKRESELISLTEQNQRLDEEINSSERQYITAQQELDKLTEIVQNIRVLGEDLSSKTAVTRRAAYKTEEAIGSLEKEKLLQDSQLLRLEEQKTRLENEIAVTSAQLEAQNAETRAARDTLAEAETETDALRFEEKQLAQQWKASVVGVQRRDAALRAVELEHRESKERVRALKMEYEGTKSRIADEQSRHEGRTTIYNKVLADISSLKRQLEAQGESSSSMEEKSSLLARALDQCENEILRVQQERQRSAHVLALKKKKGDAVAQQVLNVKQEMDASMQARLEHSKNSSSVGRSISKLGKESAGIQNELAGVDNELARIRVDSLHTQKRCESLSEEHSILQGEIGEAESKIDRHEVEIRRRNDAIGKKQTEVDRLNRQLEKLLSGMEDENTGPLEATINNLRKAIVALENDSTHLQQLWLRSQEELVSLSHKLRDETEQKRVHGSRLTVLDQKRVRLAGGTATAERELTASSRDMNSLRQNLVRINRLITDHRGKQSSLAEDNLSLEMDFVARLKDAELRSVTMEENIEELQGEKRSLVSSLLEAEQQVLLWEKKIQLGKETHAALDPKVGQAEMSAMRKEIHRMELRKAELKRIAEELITQMEKAFMRRDTIARKGTTKVKSASVGRGGTRKPGVVLNKKLKASRDQLRHADAQIHEFTDLTRRIAADLDAVTSDCNQGRSQQGEAEHHISQLRVTKQLTFNRVCSSQRLVKWYHHASSRQYKRCVRGDRPDFDGEVRKAEERLGRLLEVVEKVGSAHPDRKEILLPYSRSISSNLTVEPTKK